MSQEKQQVVEHISALEQQGDKQSLVELQEKLQQALGRLAELESQKQNQDEKALTVGANDVLLKEKTEQIDIQIDQKNEDIKEQIEKIIGEIGYKEFDKTFGYFDKGFDNSQTSFRSDPDNFTGGDRFSYNTETREVLPLRSNWKKVQEKQNDNETFLAIAFDYDPEEIKGLSVDELLFVPAILNEKGKIISRGKIRPSGEEKPAEDKKPEVLNTIVEEKPGTEEYTVYDNKFVYFSSKAGSPEDSSKKVAATDLAASEGDNTFSYDLETGKVFPLQEMLKTTMGDPELFFGDAFVVTDPSKIKELAKKGEYERIRYVPAVVKFNKKDIADGEKKITGATITKMGEIYVI